MNQSSLVVRLQRRTSHLVSFSNCSKDPEKIPNWNQMLWIRTLLSWILWWNKLTVREEVKSGAAAVTRCSHIQVLLSLWSCPVDQIDRSDRSDISNRCRQYTSQSSTTNQEYAVLIFCSAVEQHNRSTWCENDRVLPASLPHHKHRITERVAVSSPSRCLCDQERSRATFSCRQGVMWGDRKCLISQPVWLWKFAWWVKSPTASINLNQE